MTMDDKQVVSVEVAFTGANVIRINRKTMQQAIEYWLNNVVLRKPVSVSNVEERPNDHVFEISIVEVITEGQS